MTQNYLSKYTVDELQGYFSDFHKDRYGFRPRFGTHEDWNNREWLEEQINYIHDEMDHMKTTFKGREELRRQGWVVEETDAELAKQAEWLKQERDREEAEAEARWNQTYALYNSDGKEIV